QYILTENDVRIKGDKSKQRTKVFYDSIITGEFPIDSFPVSKEPSPDKKVLEGYIGMLEISPYQVPFRILIPGKIKGLIVPVAASTSHIAFSTVRMELLWMGIGQVAGIAANLANNLQVEIKDIPINHLQRLLIESKQILTYFEDIENNDKAFYAVQFFGTKGFFDSYFARTKEPLFTADLNFWFKKLEELLNLKVTANTIKGKGKVTISMFMDLIKQLALYSDLLKPGDDAEKSLAQINLDSQKWLYNSRNFSLPLLRGEACIAFYNLFVAIQN
ncbi:MAG: FAD-dependent oxidoreductase, partial [Salinivirgaceae bacterium]|nr:FAD-dependent oxidoreductase [Salinivirgaceae bacterium]